MTEKQGQIVYRSLHAPKENGAALIEPSISAFALQVASFFRTAPNATRPYWGSKPFAVYKVEARITLLRMLNPEARSVDIPVVMVGHQPHLFHPGVWMKNFVTARIAERVNGVAINLVVDNDVMKSANIAVPSREVEGAIAHIAYDAYTKEMPYEERSILDREVANSFADQIVAVMPHLGREPFVAKFWQSASLGLDDTDNWGDAISSARQSAEESWGTKVADVRLSQLVGTRSFARLVLEIANDARSFAETYNTCLADYRKVHGLRSRSHPAPDLEITSGDEVELPFWLWTKGSPHRKRAFLRRNADRFTITDRESIEWSASFGDVEELLDKMLAELLSPTDEPSRPKLRPKALITTLYARLLLCDGFVHGIGGAKYDQVTEAIAARWGLGTLAPMQCATMTMRLPLPMEVISIEEVRRRKRKLRDLRYHPEKFLAEAKLPADQQSRATELSQQKQQWITVSTPEQLHERHHAIRALNVELFGMLNEVRTHAEAEYQDGLARFTAQQPWLSREFAAVLFPEEMLKAEFARVVAG